MSKRLVSLPVLFTVLLPTTITVTAFTAHHPKNYAWKSSTSLPVSSLVSKRRNPFAIHHHIHMDDSLSRRLTTKCYSSTSSSTNTNQNNDLDVLGGVSEFEQWLGGLQDCQYDSSSLCHDAFFGSLRGLTFKNNIPTTDGKTKILQIPQSVVLRSKFDETWDSSLAQELWEQIQLRQKSKISGYCALLTNGWRTSNGDSSSSSSIYVPPPTAPDAIRHWTSSQKECLNESVAGRKLLELQQLQQDQWKQKYQKMEQQSSSPMTWEQFSWSMEVVHSRSFRGNFESVGDSWPMLIPSIGAPAVAAIVGYNFFIKDNPYPNDAALIGLGLVAALPTLLNVLTSSSKESVVLLPMIDSANHMESADSLIELDPVSNCFTLSVGSNCVVMEKDENEQAVPADKPQLYISYGTKKDSELLLNYGFLPGVTKSSSMTSPAQDNDNADCNDDYRKRLAETFISRN